jgi:hypothetical protein
MKSIEHNMTGKSFILFIYNFGVIDNFLEGANPINLMIDTNLN